MVPGKGRICALGDTATVGCLEEEIGVAKHREGGRPVRVSVHHVQRLQLHRISERFRHIDGLRGTRAISDIWI